VSKIELELIYALIVLFGLSSYIVGAWQMIRNQYSPSTFSRVVWVLLAINSFAAVCLSHSSHASILLGAVALAGNVLICTLSFSKGTKTIGKMEYICIALLILSVLIWIFFNAPLVNLSISLFAHFVGAAPTYKKVWLNPNDESLTFWMLFFIASVLSIFISDFSSIKSILLPLYCALFDGSIMVLALRRYDPKFMFLQNSTQKSR
jgi:hypothetical protein